MLGIGESFTNKLVTMNGGKRKDMSIKNVDVTYSESILQSNK